MRKLKKKRAARTCGEYITDRATMNRSRQVEELFTALERELIRERLNTDAPTREREENTP